MNNSVLCSYLYSYSNITKSFKYNDIVECMYELVPSPHHHHRHHHNDDICIIEATEVGIAVVALRQRVIIILLLLYGNNLNPFLSYVNTYTRSCSYVSTTLLCMLTLCLGYIYTLLNKIGK